MAPCFLGPNSSLFSGECPDLFSCLAAKLDFHGLWIDHYFCVWVCGEGWSGQNSPVWAFLSLRCNSAWALWQVLCKCDVRWKCPRGNNSPDTLGNGSGKAEVVLQRDASASGCHGNGSWASDTACSLVNANMLSHFQGRHKTTLPKSIPLPQWELWYDKEASPHGFPSPSEYFSGTWSVELCSPWDLL